MVKFKQVEDYLQNGTGTNTQKENDEVRKLDGNVIASLYKEWADKHYQNADIREVVSKRYFMLESIPDLLHYAKLVRREADNSQLSMFKEDVEKPFIANDTLNDKGVDSMVRKEKTLIGNYFSHNPSDAYLGVKLRWVTHTWNSLLHSEDDVSNAFILDYVIGSKIVTYSGGKMRLELYLEDNEPLFFFGEDMRLYDGLGGFYCLFKVDFLKHIGRMKVRGCVKCMNLDPYKGKSTLRLGVNEKTVFPVYEAVKSIPLVIGENVMEVVVEVTHSDGSKQVKKVYKKISVTNNVLSLLKGKGATIELS